MGRNNSINVFIALTATSVFLLLLNIFPAVYIFKNAGAKVLFPAVTAVNLPIEQAGETIQQFNFLFNFKKENEELKQEILNLKAERKNTSFLESRIAELSRLLNICNNSNQEFIPVKIIMHSPEDYFTSMNIDKGRLEGIARDMTAVGIAGHETVLMGRVNEVYDNYSSISVITSPDFKCGAQLPSGDRGVVSGRNDWLLKMEYLSPDAGIKVGDTVFSSGTGGIIPAGLVIGKVTKVSMLEFSKGKEALLAPVFYPQNCRNMFIIKKK